MNWFRLLENMEVESNPQLIKPRKKKKKKKKQPGAKN